MKKGTNGLPTITLCRLYPLILRTDVSTAGLGNYSKVKVLMKYVLAWILVEFYELSVNLVFNFIKVKCVKVPLHDIHIDIITM